MFSTSPFLCIVCKDTRRINGTTCYSCTPIDPYTPKKALHIGLSPFDGIGQSTTSSYPDFTPKFSSSEEAKDFSTSSSYLSGFNLPSQTVQTHSFPSQPMMSDIYRPEKTFFPEYIPQQRGVPCRYCPLSGELCKICNGTKWITW